MTDVEAREKTTLRAKSGQYASLICSAAIVEPLGLGRPPAQAAPEETVVVDGRCAVGPTQMVEDKLERMTSQTSMLVSHMRMRKLLCDR